MKKCMYMIVGIILLITVQIVGCEREKKENPEDQTIKIGVAIYRGDDTFISSVKSEMEDITKEIEDKFDKKVLLNFEDAKNSQSSQNDQVDNFISKGYDAICVNMVDRTVAAVIIDKAKEADIPLIFFNREPVEEDLKIWNQVFYVGSDAKEAGTLQGQMFAEAYKADPQSIDKNKDGKIQYVMLEGEQVHQDSLIRTEYSIKTITNAGVEMEKLASGTGNWMRTLAYEKMWFWMGEYGDNIEAVIANNDEMALGAVEALAEQYEQEEWPAIVGIDGTKEGTEAVENGLLIGTIKNDAKEQARAILQLACTSALKISLKENNLLLKGQYIRVPHQIVLRQANTIGVQ